MARVAATAVRLGPQTAFRLAGHRCSGMVMASVWRATGTPAGPFKAYRLSAEITETYRHCNSGTRGVATRRVCRFATWLRLKPNHRRRDAKNIRKFRVSHLCSIRAHRSQNRALQRHEISSSHLECRSVAVNFCSKMAIESKLERLRRDTGRRLPTGKPLPV